MTAYEVNELLCRRDVFELFLQRDLRLIALINLQNSPGVGDDTMRHKAVPAATMIVAAGLIGVTQAPCRARLEHIKSESASRCRRLHCLRTPLIGSGRDTAYVSGGSVRTRKLRKS
jgi:hypothetical protein